MSNADEKRVKNLAESKGSAFGEEADRLSCVGIFGQDREAGTGLAGVSGAEARPQDEVGGGDEQNWGVESDAMLVMSCRS